MAFKKQSNEVVNISNLTWVAETEKAYLIRDAKGKENWIPKSQIKAIEYGNEVPGKKGKTEKEILSLTMAQWLAEKLNLA